MHVGQHQQARADENHHQEAEREKHRRRHPHRRHHLRHLVEIGNQYEAEHCRYGGKSRKEGICEQRNADKACVGQKNQQRDGEKPVIEPSRPHFAPDNVDKVVKVFGQERDYKNTAHKPVDIVLDNLVVIESQTRHKQRDKQKTAHQNDQIANC